MGEEPTISIPLTVTEWLHLMDATYYLSTHEVAKGMKPCSPAYKELHTKIAKEFYDITQRICEHVDKGGLKHGNGG